MGAKRRKERALTQSKSLAEQEAKIHAAKYAEMDARVRACHAEVSSVMQKHRCSFAPQPVYKLVQDGSGFVTIIDLRFKANP